MSQPSDTTSDQANDEKGPILSLGDFELRLDHPLVTQTAPYIFAGQLQGGGAERFCDGGSFQLRNINNGLVEEAYFTLDCRFCQTLTLPLESDAHYVVALCDTLGEVIDTMPITIRHRAAGLNSQMSISAAVLAVPFAVEVRNRAGLREMHVLATAHASLPGKFMGTYRTTDQCGRIIVPLWEGSRPVHQLTVDELDPHLPIGAPVHVELQIESDRAMTLRVLVRQAGRGETVHLPAPAVPQRPTSEDIDAVVRRIEQLLPEFTGKHGLLLRDLFHQNQKAIQDALQSNEDQKAGAGLAALRDQRDAMELAKLQIAYPPLLRLRRLVKRCLFEAADLADRTGCDREQLFARIYAQEQTAEQSHAEKNAILYRDSIDQLASLAADLERMQQETLPYGLRDQPRAPSPSEAIDELKDLEAYVAVVLAEAELLGQTETANRLRAIDQHRVSLADRARQDAAVAVRDTRRALAEVASLEQALTGGRTRVTVPMEGMLEAAT